jgi:hypothetical protein
MYVPTNPGLPDIIPISKPKISVWANFGGSCNGSRYILWTFGQFYGILVFLLPFDSFYDHLVYFVVIWYIFAPFWYVAPRKIWHPLKRPFLTKAAISFLIANILIQEPILLLTTNLHMTTTKLKKYYETSF